MREWFERNRMIRKLGSKLMLMVAMVGNDKSEDGIETEINITDSTGALVVISVKARYVPGEEWEDKQHGAWADV